MKFDLELTHVGYAGHAVHGGHRFGRSRTEGSARALATVKRLWCQMVEFLRPISPEEDFLNQAQNCADLERRMRIVMSPQRWRGHWQD